MYDGEVIFSLLGHFSTDSVVLTNNTNSGENVLNEGEINRYIKSTTLQLQITKFLYQNIKGPAPNLSVFGNAIQRSALAEQVIVLHNFDLAFQIIQEYRLPIKQIYINAVAKIVQKKQLNKVNDLLRSIQGTITEDEWDEVVLACITSLANDVNEPKTAEKWITKLTNNSNKVIAHIACGKLKAAYLLAVKCNLRSSIELIREEAKKTESLSIVDLCDRYLSERQ